MYLIRKVIAYFQRYFFITKLSTIFKMKSFLMIIISLLIGHFLNAQHTTRFLEIVKDLEKISCKTDTTYYKNGKIWWTTCWTTYKYNSENYSARTGKMTQYYKNGQIVTEYRLDEYGNIKSMKTFDRNGNKTKESATTKIDSKAKSLDEFFVSQDHMNFKTFTLLYKFSKKLGIWYIYKEGNWINNKKKGVWITYYDTGKIKKEKKY